MLAGRSFAGEPEPLIRKQVSEVHFTLVATDRNNRPLPSLSAAEIMVLEDGQPISRFELRAAGDLPLRVGLVLDLSDSTQRSWPVLRSALARSLGQVMRPSDRLLVLAFNSKIEWERTMADPSELETALGETPRGGLTALYDTIYRACGHEIFSRDQAPHRAAIILFSDGEDDLSLHGLNDAIAQAESDGILIYTVATHKAALKKPGDAVLHDIAEATGGRDFVVKDSNQLQDALSAINQELRNSYLLYYRPRDEAGGRSFRRVQVSPTAEGGPRVRSRTGYFFAP